MTVPFCQIRVLVPGERLDGHWNTGFKVEIGVTPRLRCGCAAKRRSHKLGLVPGKRGGLNGSTQHSARTHLVLKTKVKIAR